MDIQLPGEDGLVLHAAAQGATRDRAIPIVAMTAHAMQGDASWRWTPDAPATSPSPSTRARWREQVRRYLAVARVTSRVLIIDDEPANVLLLESMLAEQPELEIKSVTDSRLAEREFLDFEPDIVLLDLHMPKPDGIEILTRLRSARESLGFLPVVVLSADTTRLARNSALVLGADDFLLKPLDREEVLLRVRNLLHTRRLYTELASAKEALERHEAQARKASRKADGCVNPTVNMQPEPRTHAIRAMSNPPLILIVEDNVGSLMLATVDARNRGFRGGRRRSRPRRPVICWRRKTPDLILMDIQLPGMDGLEFTKELKADPTPPPYR